MSAGFKILAVDDSSFIRKIFEKELTKAGFIVETAKDGNHALERIETFTFDLVLLDIVMPGIDGLEVLKRIRAEQSPSKLPVIMVTSRDSAEMIVKALRMGANDYITKPLDMDIALARIGTQLELKRYAQDLERSNQLKDLFIDIMRHDLLRPSQVAKLSLQLLLEKEDDPEKTSLIQTTLDSNDQFIDMIENASVLARLESCNVLSLEPLDASALLDTAVRDLENSAESRQMVIEVHSPKTKIIDANPLLYDVFSNLLGNAVKYGKEGTPISTGLNGNGGWLNFWVTNQGEPIPKEYREEIFTRFRRINKGGVEGTGLGLAIVKRVVDAHDGRVWVEDNPLGGATFKVALPLSGGS